MTITLSPADYSRLFVETASVVMGESNAVCSYPACLGQGEFRWFELRDGLELAIDQFCHGPIAADAVLDDLFKYLVEAG